MMNHFHWAVKDGEEKTVKFFIKKGIDLNAKCVLKKRTALHYASEHNHIDITKILIENGAIVDDRDVFGQTPLHIAVMNGHPKIVKLLIEKGADPHAKDAKLRTALHKVLDYSKESRYFVRYCPILAVEICEILFKNEIDINAKDRDDENTALHLALINDGQANEEIIQVILRFGANIELTNAKHLTALDFAIWNRNLNMIKILIENGACPSNTRRFDFTTCSSSLEIALFLNDSLFCLKEDRHKMIKTMLYAESRK